MTNNELVTAIIAATACNGWVIWVTAQAYITGIQSRIANANYRLRISQALADAAAEDEKQEQNSTI